MKDLLVLPTLLTLLAAASINASAADLVWNGTSSDNVWDTSATANWLDGTAAATFGAGDNVSFSEEAAYKTISLSDAVSTGNITFANTDAYSLGGTGTIAMGTGTMLDKSGAGAVTINSVNGHTFGAISVSSGTLDIKNTAQYNGNIVVDGAGSALTFSGAAANNLIQMAAGTSMTVKNGGLINFSLQGNGYNSDLFGRDITITAEGGGMIKTSGAHALGRQVTNRVTVVLNNGTLTLGGDQYLKALYLNGGTVSGGNFRINNTTITVGGTSASTYGGQISFYNSDPLTLNVGVTGDTNPDLTISGVISGGGKVIKTGAGTLRLANSNTYTGTTTVAAGVLELNAGGGNGAIQGTVNVEDGATLRFLATDAAGYNTRKITALNLNGGTLDIATTNAGGNQAFSTTVISMTGGKITGIANRAVEFTNDVSVAVNSAARTSVIENVNLKIRTNTTFAVAAGTAASGVDLEVSSGITPGYGSPVVGITKTGAGTMLLSGTNTYTGGTVVNEGKLLINGNNSSATGTVTVNTGATLGGSGTIGGDIVINAGGILSPGNSIDTLNANGNVALAAGATLLIEINSLDGTAINSADQLLLAAGKSITFEAGSNLQIVFTDQMMDNLALSSVFGTEGDYSSLANATITGNGQLYQFDGVGNITLVPEPSTYAFFGAVGGLALVALRRRKKPSH
jgi:fibronectin-binding autotransporter adhesin